MDPISELQAITEELDEHGKRVGARADELSRAAQAEQNPIRREYLDLISQCMREQTDTCLDFLREALIKVGEVAAEMGGGGDDDVDIGIEADDADKILKVLNAFSAMLDAAATQLPPGASASDRKRLEEQQAECKEAIEIVEKLAIEPDDDEEEDEEDKDAEPN